MVGANMNVFLTVSWNNIQRCTNDTSSLLHIVCLYFTLEILCKIMIIVDNNDIAEVLRCNIVLTQRRLKHVL